MADFFSEYGIMLLTETGATLAMTLISTLVAYVVGIPVGVLVTITNEHSVLPGSRSTGSYRSSEHRCDSFRGAYD